MREFGPLEAAIMRCMWDLGRPASVRDLHDDFFADRHLAYTTVMTVMVALCRKGLLARSRHGRAYVYRPTCRREQYAAQLMTEALEQGGDQAEVLTQFLALVRPAERSLLLQVLGEARPDPRDVAADS
ncbi:MAG: BlaI/MecI/CopY family transcriptional regulator [Natronosporangium sp.]